MVFVVLSAPLSGCFGSSESSLTSEDLGVVPGTLVSGVFQDVTLEAGKSMSVFVPYLVRDPITGFVELNCSGHRQGGVRYPRLTRPTESLAARDASRRRGEDKLASEGS